MVAFVDFGCGNVLHTLCQDATDGTLSHLWILLLDIGVYMFEFTMKRPPVQKGVCEFLGCASWHVRPFSSVVTQRIECRIESYWMRKHYKRCVSVCVCLCMHRYPKTSFLKLRPIEPFGQGLSKSADLCKSYESSECASHVWHVWHVLIVWHRLQIAQAKRKSQKCSAASALERHVGKAADWTILLAALGAKMSIQMLTYSMWWYLRGMVALFWSSYFLSGYYRFDTDVLDRDEMAQAFADIVKECVVKELSSHTQTVTQKLLGRPWQEYEGLPDFARLCPFKQSAFIAKTRSDGIKGCVFWQYRWSITLVGHPSPFCLAKSTTSGSTKVMSCGRLSHHFCWQILLLNGSSLPW